MHKKNVLLRKTITDLVFLQSPKDFWQISNFIDIYFVWQAVPVHKAYQPCAW